MLTAGLDLPRNFIYVLQTKNSENKKVLTITVTINPTFIVK